MSRSAAKTVLLRVYVPRSVELGDDLPFLPNLLGRYFDPSEFSVVRDCGEDTRLVVLPCSNSFSFSRKLAARKPEFSFVYDFLPEAALDALRQGRMRLVLDMGAEMFYVWPKFIDGLHEGLAEIGLSRSQALIVNCDASAESNYLQYCEGKGIADPVPILMSNAQPLFFLAHHRMTADAFRAYTASNRAGRENAKNKRVFVSFNGRSRPHRIYAVLLLMAYELLNSGFVSLLYHGSWNTGTLAQRRDREQVKQASSDLRSIFAGWPNVDVCLPHLETLLGSMPLELDLTAEKSISNDRFERQTAWEMQRLDLYQRSYLSLLTDTFLSSDNQLAVTEKVFKCFVGFHPFIYIGSSHALDRLRALGFQTFHPLIDESYDLEIDGPTRLVKAVAELRRLASLSDDRLQDLYAALWPRIEHNARHACVNASSWGKTNLEHTIRQRLLAFSDVRR